MISALSGTLVPTGSPTTVSYDGSRILNSKCDISEAHAGMPMVPATFSIVHASVGTTLSPFGPPFTCRYRSTEVNVRGLHHGPCSLGSLSNRIGSLASAHALVTGITCHSRPWCQYGLSAKSSIHTRASPMTFRSVRREIQKSKSLVTPYRAPLLVHATRTEPGGRYHGLVPPFKNISAMARLTSGSPCPYSSTRRKNRSYMNAGLPSVEIIHNGTEGSVMVTVFLTSLPCSSF